MIESSNTPTGSKTGTELNDGRLISVGAGALNLNAILHVPPHARGLVILASGIEDSTSTPHQDALALSRVFFNKHLASLLVDLFIIEEQQMDQQTAFFRHNADIMQQRLIGIADWLLQNQETANFSIGCFGSGTCGAAALIAAAQRPDAIRAVAAAAGRFDLTQQYLPRITIPTLLLAPEQDSAEVQANQQALEHLEGLTTNKEFEKVPGVSSLFETSNALAEVARVTSEWFARWLIPIV